MMDGVNNDVQSAIDAFPTAPQGSQKFPVVSVNGEDDPDGTGTTSLVEVQGDAGRTMEDGKEKKKSIDGECWTEEEDEEICRICRCGTEADRPLFHPCICTGSIKFVHEDCLLEWLSHSSTNNSRRAKCELCGHRFGFTPVYEAGAPSSLTVWEMAKLSSMRVIRVLPLGLRLGIVIVTWGIFIPIATCVMFRILSLGKLDRNGQGQLAVDGVSSGWGTFLLRLRLALDGGYYSTWSIGVCASASIFLSFLTLISVVDFVREHEENEAFARMDADGNDEEDLEVEIGENVDADHQAIPQEQNNNGNVPADAVEPQPRDEADVNLLAQGAALDQNNNETRPQADVAFEIDNNNHEAGNDALPQQAVEIINNNPIEAQQHDEDDDNEGENAPEPGEAAFLGGGVDGFMDEDDDNVDHAPDLDVAMDELLGLRGPGWVLFHNVLWLLTFNGLYLCVALFAPTTVGAVVISIFNRLLHKIGGVEILTSEEDAFLLRKLHKLRTELQHQSFNEEMLRASKFGPLLSQPRETKQVMETCSLDQDRTQFMEELHWICLELVAVLVGYIAVAGVLACLYQVARIFKKTAHYRSSRRGWGKITRIFKLMSRTFKVVIIVFLKMGVFPVLLGVLLEIASRDLISLGGGNRYQFATEHPVFAVMVLWVAGITHMLIITVMVLELRDILHPDILHGIIRPKDADESLLRTVLEDSVSKHMRRMALSCAIYTALVIMFIQLPVMLFRGMGFGSMLPFRPFLHYVLLEVQLPVELFCIHISVLNLLDQGKHNIRAGIENWFKCVAGFLGLTSYILPIPDPNAPTTSVVNQHNEVDPRLGLLPRELPSFRCLRLLAISFLAWLTCMVVSILGVITPHFVGRATINLLELPFTHEPLVYGIGCFVIWRTAVLLAMLRIHRIPVALYQAWNQTRPGRFLSSGVVKSYVQWFVFVILALGISPWLMGVMMQLIFLLPQYHPKIISGSSCSEWPFANQLHGLIVALFGLAGQATMDDTTSYKGWDPASDMKDDIGSMYLSSSPLHDWMVGLVLESILFQIFLVPDLAQQEGIGALQRRVNQALEEIIHGYDCSRMLHDFVLPYCAIQLSILISPLASQGLTDAMFYMLGITLESYCIVYAYRRSGLVLAILVAVPYVGLEAKKTCMIVHDALRDERYLVGKRLHNMKRTEKKYAQKL